MKSARNTIGTILLLGSTCCLVWFFAVPFFKEDAKQTSSSGEVFSVNDPLVSDVLSIPSLGISAPLIYGVEKNEDAFQEALQSGVVHFPGTALPGGVGNAYFFGHSSDFLLAKGEYKTVFARLPEIQKGADIYLSTQKGQVVHYRVQETRIVSPVDLSVLAQGTEFILTLQTSYPVGTAKERFLVIAEMVSTERGEQTQGE